MKPARLEISHEGTSMNGIINGKKHWRTQIPIIDHTQLLINLQSAQEKNCNEWENPFEHVMNELWEENQKQKKEKKKSNMWKK